MNFATFTTVAVIALTGAFASAEEVASVSGETNTVIALADAGGARDVEALDGLAGLYRTPSGESFFVERAGDGLTIETPVTAGAEPLRLAAESAGYVFVANDATRVVFESDEAGRVTGLRFFAPDSDAISAAKTSRRHGIVLIYDVPKHGIVQIYDVI